MPASTSTVASSSLATVMPSAPAAIWRCAIAIDLCVLKWGRKSSPRSAASPAIVAMFRSSRSRSTTRAGVSAAVQCRPTRFRSAMAVFCRRHLRRSEG